MELAPIFSEWFGTGPSAGRVCAALYSADTRPLTVADLITVTGCQKNTVHAALVALRQAAEPGALVTDGVRYALTEAGVDDCNAAIADAASRAGRAAA